MGKARQPGQKKRHHYVPRVILRRFTNGDGRFWLYRKKAPQEGVIPAHPDTDFFRTHLYSSIAGDGSRDVALEDWFSGREDMWGPLLDRIIPAIETGSLNEIIGEDRSHLAELLYYQWVRTPEFHNKVATIEEAEHIIRKITLETEKEIGRSLTNEERKAVTGIEAAKNIRHNTIVEGLLHGKGGFAENMIRQSRLQTATLQRGIPPFVVGSFPIAVIPSAASALNGGRSEIWLPIASRCAISPIGSGSGISPAPISHARIRAINQSIFAQSEVIACVDRAELQGLVEANLRRSSQAAAVPVSRLPGT